MNCRPMSYVNVQSLPGEVVEVVWRVLLAGGDPEWLHVDAEVVVVVAGPLLEGEDQLGGVLLHQPKHLLRVPAHHRLVVDLHNLKTVS